MLRKLLRTMTKISCFSLNGFIKWSLLMIFVLMLHTISEYKYFLVVFLAASIYRALKIGMNFAFQFGIISLERSFLSST